MASLHHVLDNHPTLLLIDSASSVVQVGLWRKDQPTLWSRREGEAGEQVFAGARDVLARGGIGLNAVDAFAFCDGPGSVLGIRTAATALRTWGVLRPYPIFAYCGLSVVARHWTAVQGRRKFAVIADARRDSWHHVDVDAEGQVSPLKRIPTASLSGDLLVPEGFRRWSVPPPVETVSYSLEELLPPLADAELFELTSAPDAFLHEEPVYQTWTPQVHRAPTP